MWFITSILSAALFGMSGFVMKLSNYKRRSLPHLLFGLYLSGTVCFALWVSVAIGWELGIPLVIAGLVVGFGTSIGNILFMKALDVGPASLTSPMVNLNIVVVVVMSIWFFGENLSWTETLAIILLIGSIMLLPIDPHESLAIRNGRWYSLVLLAIVAFALRNAGLKITEELNMQNGLVLFLAYFFSVLWFGLQIRNKGIMVSAATKYGTVLGLVAGVFSFAGLQLYAHSLKIGPASIVSPIFATNSLVVAILSILFLKERLSLLQGIALTFLFVGLVILRI